MGACSCGTVSQKQLDSLKTNMATRSEKVIVDWSKAQYVGGIFGNDSTEGLTCLTNLNLYYVSTSMKFEQALKNVYEVVSIGSYKPKKKGDFTMFKLQNDKEFVMLFLENKDKLKEDCKSLIAEKRKSLVEIEVL